MPLYEYECESCQKVVEALVRNEQEHHEQEESACPACGNRSLHRVFSVPASPSVRSASGLPVTGESCGAPRCCGGGCQME